MKKIPWHSLAILFVTYSSFGWTLSKSNLPLIIWIFPLATVFLLAAALTAPLKNSKRLIFSWFKTDVGAFLSITTTAFFAVIVFAWLHVFATGLILLSAGALARLDIQTLGFKKWQAFGILSLVSLTGLVCGVGMQLCFPYL
ncbi:hypothetical protein BCD67_17375 [Oscillatoriales cyanobacterium USR001]|nr:hypothetical protein BCD67_17375 [Oscillatoriales cyanobacterium USR001]